MSAEVTQPTRFWRVWQPARGERPGRGADVIVARSAFEAVLRTAPHPGPTCVQEVVLTADVPRALSGADKVVVTECTGRQITYRAQGLRVRVVDITPREWARS